MSNKKEQKKQKSKINKDFKINLHSNHRINMEKVYFIAGLGTEADRVESTKTTHSA